MNRSASGVTLVLLAVAAAALLGLAVIASPGVALPFSIELLLLLVLTVWGLSREPDLDLRRWLVRLALAALALRLLLVLVVQFRFSPYFFAPDAQAYERIGREISNYWSGEGFAPRAIREGWRPGYYHLNAVFYSAFGDSRLALVVINMFAGVWTALFTFYLTKEFLPVASAKVAALLTGVFPSLVLWSVLNIRDSLATLCTVMLVLYAIRLTKRFQPYDLWAFLGALLGLGLLRDYMAFLVLLGLVIGSVTAVRPDRMFATMLFGTIAAVALTYLADQVGLFSSIRPEGLLETAQILRSGLQQGAVSAFGVGADTGTIGAALRYIPIGASFLLFAPFPWDIQSTLQATAMGETLLWYPLFLLSILGFRISFRDRLPAALVPVSVLLVVVSSYALVEGNFGTAYRHRAQIMPLFFIFSGIGLSWIKIRVIDQTQWWRTRAR
ncbi:MAG: glycosyltransferase family 39 protein [Gemmatimonadetes bacterium]|nr:glycosyltransferase family 39 protein [Gemmatimonadota bacterium]